MRYYDFYLARLSIFEFIKAWYNRKRIHGAIGYINPQMKENQCKNIL